MNRQFEAVKDSDAVFFVIDRECLKSQLVNWAVHKALHKSQVELFQHWHTRLANLPILIFGRVWPRISATSRIVTSCPMTFCGDENIAAMALLIHHGTALSDPRVKSFACEVLLTNNEQAATVLAAAAVTQRRGHL